MAWKDSMRLVSDSRMHEMTLFSHTAQTASVKWSLVERSHSLKNIDGFDNSAAAYDHGWSY